MENINRRAFLKTSLAVSAVAALPGPAASAAPSPAAGERDLLELRCYRLKPGASAASLDGYLAKAFIPALNRRGIGAVGVFTEPDPKDGPAVWVLFAHPSFETVIAVDAAVNADPQVLEAGSGYLNATKENPSFERVDSWLHLSFAGQPKLAVPSLAREGKARIFEMRTYESHSETKALKKVEMFNAGEIGVMQQLNLSPVFYGQALLGRDLPHLTYMLCSPDLETHKRNWAAFGVDPTWVKLKNDPQYADTVSRITSRFMVPAAYSQI